MDPVDPMDAVRADRKPTLPALKLMAVLLANKSPEARAILEESLGQDAIERESLWTQVRHGIRAALDDPRGKLSLAERRKFTALDREWPLRRDQIKPGPADTITSIRTNPQLLKDLDAEAAIYGLSRAAYIKRVLRERVDADRESRKKSSNG